MKNIKIQQMPDNISTKKDIIAFFNKKTECFHQMILSTLLAVQKYKILNFFSAKEFNSCIQGLETINDHMNSIIVLIKKPNCDQEDILTRLQTINNELSQIFRSYGTLHIKDLLQVCFGVKYRNIIMDKNKYKMVENFIHPIGYKIMDWKQKGQTSPKKLAKNRIVEDYMIVEIAKTLDCFDLARTSKGFQKRVYGVKIAFQNKIEKKTLIVTGIVDDLMFQSYNYPFIQDRIKSLKESIPPEPDFSGELYNNFLDLLTIKEYLIYSNSELRERYTGYITKVKLIKQKTISQTIKEFINDDMYAQRTTLTQLLMHNTNPEFQYLAYLLYDLLSNDNNGTVDTTEQTLLYDSLPWRIKKYFKEAMKTTSVYTKSLSDFNNSKIKIEQQICLMKANDTIKEKAMIKLKEVKAKTEESGTKARQYLEGLLKIPFGIYRQEPMLTEMKNMKDMQKDLIRLIKDENYNLPSINSNKKMAGGSIIKNCLTMENEYNNISYTKIQEKLCKIYTSGKRNQLIANVCFINHTLKKCNISKAHICHSGKRNNYMKECITDIINKFKSNTLFIEHLKKNFKKHFEINKHHKIVEKFTNLKSKWGNVQKSMANVENVLEEAIYGHKQAKRQIERIIGQWINGEQTGYCFGFEGPPGIGKTSLAKKGLAYCLKGENNTPRPFAFIAIGGSCNGSTLSGHSYTYVGSTWGRIVDVLMEKKCMNPIIFIDELDKVSHTEHGKDIISILTQLTDSTQNDAFQDKYFSGVDLDLSKILFIFSYNNAQLIDPILLDRIHRIKFKELSTQDKLIIAKKFILPELFTKLGLEGCLQFPEETLRLVIENYTYEAGVRKLKENLFEIISEINLKILKQEEDYSTFPIIITPDDITNIYLKEKHPIRHACIHEVPKIAIMNGLWANSLGLGGIIPIECNWFPSSKFLELKLTGLQGDVMKESMNVAKTLAWNQTPSTICNKKMKEFKKNNSYGGIHIHCPEGAVPKDGPSAGTAITVALYSLINKKKIKNNIAITGEINLQGNITAIGGLDIKILGGIRAGIKEFIFPAQNKKTFNEFIEKNKKAHYEKDIRFHMVKNIKEVLKLVFV
jgi:endopeptidase La